MECRAADSGTRPKFSDLLLLLMAGLLPLVHGFGTCLYPVTRRIVFDTAVNISLNATEQRAKRRPPLTDVTLPYTHVSHAELVTFQNFYESQKGTFDASWAMVVGRAALATVAGTSVTLTSGSFFSAADTGSQIVVAGAGPAGALLATTMTFLTPTTATLAAGASTSVVGADTRWGVYLPNLTFLDANFEATENPGSPTTYSFSLHARQTKTPAVASGSPGGTFPTFTGGFTSQLPYVQQRRFSVLLNDAVSGLRRSYTWFGGGLTGFPTAGLHGWTVNASALADSLLPTWETFFRNQWGRKEQFTFTDLDTAVSYPNCRLDQDELAIQHQGPNNSALMMKVMEFFV
jgi:hypothetical protein